VTGFAVSEAGKRDFGSFINITLQVQMRNRCRGEGRVGQKKQRKREKSTVTVKVSNQKYCWSRIKIGRRRSRSAGRIKSQGGNKPQPWGDKKTTEGKE